MNKKINDMAFSPIELVEDCLVDESRTKKFLFAINKHIKKGDIVADCGTGTGVMSLFAARAGAKKVYAVEYDSYVASVAKNNVIVNKYDKVIDVVQSDARTVQLPIKKPLNVFIMEMLTTGVVDEFQVQATNHFLEKKYIDESTVLIPFRHDTFVRIADFDYTKYGLSFTMLRHVWNSRKKYTMSKCVFFSKKELVNSLDFYKKNSIISDSTINFKVTKTGVINTLFFESETYVDKKPLLKIHMQSTLRLHTQLNQLRSRKIKKFQFALCINTVPGMEK